MVMVVIEDFRMADHSASNMIFWVSIIYNLLYFGYFISLVCNLSLVDRSRRRHVLTTSIIGPLVSLVNQNSLSCEYY